MRRLLLVLTALTLVAAACGGSDDDASVGSDPSATDVAATDPPATDPPETDPPATDPPETDPPATDPPATDPPATDPPATDPPGDDFESIERGEYAVGVQTITITDETRARPLTTDVWFPLAEGTTGEPHRYTFVTGDYYESPDAITADPSAIAPGGPYPLVAYSHGSGGTRYQSSFFTETLASHGYIVVAPDHTGNTAVDRIAGGGDDRDVIALNRVQDIGAVIDAMLNPESVETAGFVAVVDPESIAVSGHSFGGFTTYAVASGYSNALGSVDPDPRIDAIIPLAPAVGSGDETSLLSDERLASITTPALVMVGTNDQTTPADPNVDRGFGLGNSDPSYRLDLLDAQHQSFTDICDYLEFIPALPAPTEVVVETIEALAVEGCSEGDMDIERVKELTNTFGVAFLDSIFEGTEMITADTTELPDDIVFTER